MTLRVEGKQGRNCAGELGQEGCIVDADVLVKDYWQSCTICEACSRNCPQEAITVNSKPDSYIFTIESSGSITIKEIIDRAMIVFQEKIDEFLEHLKNKELFPL